MSEEPFSKGALARLTRSKMSRRTLRKKAPDIANYLGFGPQCFDEPCGGIARGSVAAWAMSVEARAHKGKVPPMMAGGVTAALQSIGSLRSIKPEAEHALHHCIGSMQQLGLQC